MVKFLEAESILVQGDSQLVIGQVNGTYEAKEEWMKKYLNKLKCLIKKFNEAHFIQIAREENMVVDTLAKEASVNKLTDEFDEVQYMPSIDLPEVQQIEGEENWMTPIISYLKEGKLPEGRDETRKLRIKSAKYILMDEVLYKRGFSQPYLRCLALDKATYVLREVHEGACGNHLGARSLFHKVICDQCQRFSNIPRQPSEYLTPMMAPWPFALWGLDILGPFPTWTKQMKFLVVGIDYFTK